MQATANRLRAALDRLTASSGAAARLTVAALAREAEVGRNAIYANHRDVLDDLARARQRQRSPDSRPAAEDRITEQRRLIDDMQYQLRQLATENAGLLRRAIEAERRAERAERRSAQLTKEIGSLQRPTMLRSQQEGSVQG
jgi:membrane-bound lytic murein transglycosylase B